MKLRKYIGKDYNKFNLIENGDLRILEKINEFLKRLYYYSTGFIIGIAVFILNGKRASCNYTPNARVIDNITSKELIIDSNSEAFFNKEEIIEILNNGKILIK